MFTEQVSNLVPYYSVVALQCLCFQSPQGMNMWSKEDVWNSWTFLEMRKSVFLIRSLVRGSIPFTCTLSTEQGAGGDWPQPS